MHELKVSALLRPLFHYSSAQLTHGKSDTICQYTIQYSKYSVVLYSNYSSSIVVLTVIASMSIEHHSSETVITILY